MLMLIVPVLLLNLLATFTPLRAFDLNSLLVLFKQSQSSPTWDCPEYCNCSSSAARDVVMRYINWYIPSMGLRMNPKVESQARNRVRYVTEWLGEMADITCRLPRGHSVNVSELLRNSSLSCKALRVRCLEDASLVWDLTHDEFLDVLDVGDCELKTAGGAVDLPVPARLKIIQLDQIDPQVAELLDLSAATELMCFSWTRSGLETLPQHWSNIDLRSLMFLNLALNDLKIYCCRFRARELLALNLDYNIISELPDCVLNGEKYTSFLSLRHNNVHDLNKLNLLAANHTHNVESVDLDQSSDKDPKLSYLDLAFNQLERLHVIRKIHLLVGIDLSHNRLFKMDVETFSLHPYLKWLDLSHNQIEFIPVGALFNQVMMSHLNLSHNRLKEFNFDQSPVSSNLLHIDLRFNRLSYPPFFDSGYVPPRMSRLLIADNPYACDCHIVPFLDLVADKKNSNDVGWLSKGLWDGYDVYGSSRGYQYLDRDRLTCYQPADLQDMPLATLNLTPKCRLLAGCPTCCHCNLFRQGTRRVVVDCSNALDMTELPAELPVVKDTPLILMLNRSGLRRLDYRPYLPYVTELEAAYSRLSFVTSEAMAALANVSVLSLHHNQLRSLPAITQNLSLPAVRTLSLASNPWVCGCQNLWMLRWLQEHNAAVYDLDNTRCHWTGQMVSMFREDDLNCGVMGYFPLVVALTMITSAATALISIFLKYRLDILAVLYAYFGVKPFYIFSYNQNRPYFFDIFLSFSQLDYQWVALELASFLEHRDNPYRLCMEERDFPAGAPLSESIAWAASNSRCTLLVLSKNFVLNEWPLPKLRAAHTRLLKERPDRLLVVVLGPLDARAVDPELLAYLRSHLYLPSRDRRFWEKLEYSLPRPGGLLPPYFVPGTPGPRRPSPEGKYQPQYAACNLPDAPPCLDDKAAGLLPHNVVPEPPSPRRQSQPKDAACNLPEDPPRLENKDADATLCLAAGDATPPRADLQGAELVSCLL